MKWTDQRHARHLEGGFWRHLRRRGHGAQGVTDKTEPPRRLVRDLVLVGTADLLKGLRFLILLPLATKLLGAEGYGVWTQVRVSSTLLATVASLGLGKAMLRFMSGEPDAARVREQFNSTLFLSVASGGVLAAGLLYLRDDASVLIFHDRQLSIFMAAVGVCVLIEIVDQIAMTYLQVTRQMAVHMGFIAVDLAGEVAAIWLLAWRGAGLGAIVFGVTAWRAIVIGVKLLWTWQQIGFSAPRIAPLRRYLAVGLPLVVSGLAYQAVNYGDRFFISFYMGIGAVGMYAAAYALGNVPVLLATPIDYVLYPTIATHWNAGRSSDAARHVDLTVQWMTIVLVPAVAALAVLAEPLIATIATSDFLPAAPAALIVAIGFAIFSVGVIGERVLVLADRSRRVTAVYAALAVVNTALNFVLIPRFALTGAAFATALSLSLYTLLMLMQARQHCRIPFSPLTTGKCVASAAIAAAVVLPWARAGAGPIALALTTGGLVYLAALAVTGVVRLGGPGRWIDVQVAS